ncbi:hypothetical protein WAK64_20715 [Bacillus spongiae]|uniref:Uncharacterized protein n=1 Tax=Bacillus spongiae TaxID=2683610 RepID=A0ABU8HJL5_9BACI
MNELSKYLKADNELMSLLNNEPAIYWIEKPKEKEHDTFIVYRYKELNGGLIKDYQFTFRLISKNLVTLKKIHEKTVKLLDQYRKIDIPNIRYCALVNGGGMARNPSTEEFESVLYFLVKK